MRKFLVALVLLMGILFVIAPSAGVSGIIMLIVRPKKRIFFRQGYDLRSLVC
jgi:hypothetical protein